jgi:hypothetical protein
MMIDATVAPKVGFISPFVTTVCNVNHINATSEPLTINGEPEKTKIIELGKNDECVGKGKVLTFKEIVIHEWEHPDKGQGQNTPKRKFNLHFKPPGS